jgi:hypothetical protein
MNPDDIKTTEDTAPSNIEPNDKAEWEAAKEAAPHPFEGNIGIGAETVNGSLSKISDMINDQINQEVSYIRENIIQELQEILYDKITEAKDELHYQVTHEISKKYNINDEDISIILKGHEEYSLEDRIDDVIEMEMEINIG